MQILVTGANGFVGQHVTHLLSEQGHTPLHCDLQPVKGAPRNRLFVGDLCDQAFLEDLVSRAKPDACIHLGGIAYVPMGWKNPQLVYNVNLGGTVNLLEAFRKHAPEARIVVVSSGEIYGRTARQNPLRETDIMYPANPYAVSKQAADQHALLTAQRYNMNIMTARPDNHTGPGQSELFVTATFARQVADIASGRRKARMLVGNLDNMRNFTDVRDIARAYLALLERGRAGTAYNIASGIPVRIRSVLDTLCRIANINPQIDIDPSRYRPTDCLPTLDTTRIHQHTGWKPQIPIQTTLQDIYQHALENAR
jgi:GDP-4-dehydro-6-deoxy-D-mannose reductase